MHLGFPVFLVLVLMSEYRWIPDDPVPCTNYEDCQDGEFCSHSYCERCIPCETFNRQPASNKASCAENWTECGPCLTGYNYRNTTVGHSYQCYPSTDERPSDRPTTPGEWRWIVVWIWLSTISLILIFMKFNVFYFIRTGSCTRTSTRSSTRTSIKL